MAKKFSSNSSTKFFISVIGLTVIALVLKELSHIFIPFVIAYFLFFLFSPLNSFLEKEKVPMLLIILADIIIVSLICWGISKFIIDSFIQFGDALPFYADKLNNIVRNASQSLGIEDPYFLNFSVQQVISEIDYQSLGGGVFTSTFSLLGNILFIIFFFVFVVTGHKTVYETIKKRYVVGKVKPELKKIKKQLTISDPEHIDRNLLDNKLINEKQGQEEKLILTFKAITGQIQRYIIAKIGVNLFAGIAAALMLFLFGIDFAIILGLFTFLFNFIPAIGSAIALILPVLMTLLQYESISLTIIIAVLIGILQTVFFNILEPMIIGKRLNLNPLLILLSVLIWGYIWGIVGMLLSVPLTAIIKIIISNSESKNLKFINDLME